MGKWKKSRLHGCHGWVGWELKRVRLFGGLQLYFISVSVYVNIVHSLE